MSVLTRSHVRVALLSLVLSGLIAALVADPSAQQASRPEGSISGVVQSSQGPEAGVWVIAETNDLPTQFVKIVVTNDDGRFLVPELPAATYDVWVRGYGLVDSTPIEASPGATLTLNASLASTPRGSSRSSCSACG